MEASLVLPFFAIAMSLLAYMGVLMTYEDEVQWALTRTAREASVMYGATGKELYQSTVYYQGKMALYLKDSPVSVWMVASEYDQETDEIMLVADYQVDLPFQILQTHTLLFREQLHTRAFTGVETREKTNLDDTLVYITETGRVYHLKQDCPYLKLSISQMKYGDLDSLRNAGGGKYKECEKCCKNKSFQKETSVWITNFGDRFHSTGSCSGLKRYIREIKRSEAGSRTICSKCGNES